MHHLRAFSHDLNPDEQPKQMLKNQRLPLPHQTLGKLRSCQKQPASCVGLALILQDFLANQQGHAHSQGLQGI